MVRLTLSSDFELFSDLWVVLFDSVILTVPGQSSSTGVSGVSGVSGFSGVFGFSGVSGTSRQVHFGLLNLVLLGCLFPIGLLILLPGEKFLDRGRASATAKT